MNILIKLIFKLLKKLKNIVLAHCRALASQLDPVICPKIVSANNTENDLHKIHFIFPFVFIFLTYFYGIFGLHYTATGCKLNSLKTFKTSPHVFTHQVAPKTIWEQFDFVILFCDFFAMTGVYLALYFTEPVNKRYRFFLSNDGKKLFVNGKTLPITETRELLQVRKFLKNGVTAFSGTFYIFLMTFFFANVVLNDVYISNISSVLYWIILLPLLFAYLIYGK